MMNKITRNEIFETNSSSTHAISIPKHLNYILPPSISFNYRKFGWHHDNVSPEDYLYTALGSFGKSGPHYFNQMKNWLESDGIKVYAEHPDNSKGTVFPKGYIDHGEELYDFINEIMNDKDKLYRYLFGGEVITGNDNDGHDVESEIGWGNPDYDFYYKGN